MSSVRRTAAKATNVARQTLRNATKTDQNTLYGKRTPLKVGAKASLTAGKKYLKAPSNPWALKKVAKGK